MEASGVKFSWGGVSHESPKNRKQSGKVGDNLQIRNSNLLVLVPVLAIALALALVRVRVLALVLVLGTIVNPRLVYVAFCRVPALSVAHCI